jgi:hypothetical protein
MKKEVFISGEYLLALSMLSCTDDLGEYTGLSGVHLRFKEDSVFIEATNYMSGGVLKLDIPDQIGGENQFQPNDTCIIPLKCLMNVEPKRRYMIKLENDIISVSYNGISISSPVIEKDYPNVAKWVKIQSTKDVESADYNPDLLNVFRNIGSMLGAGYIPSLIQRGAMPATVLFRLLPDFVGFITPFIFAKVPVIPEWLNNEVIEEVQPVRYFKCKYGPEIYVAYSIDDVIAYLLNLNDSYWTSTADDLINGDYEEVGPDYTYTDEVDGEVPISQHSPKEVQQLIPGQAFILDLED